MAWLGRTSFIGLSRLEKCPDLSHQAQLILYVPRLGDLAFLYAVDGDAREFHLLAARRSAHMLTPVGGSAPPASNHLILLSYEVLNDAYHVRKASPEICCLVLGSLGLIGCEELLCCVELTCMVPELLLLPTHHGLVLFSRHPRLLLPRPLSPGGPQHTVHDATRRYPVHPSFMPLPRPTRRQRWEWDRYRLLVGGRQFVPRWERQPACGVMATFNEGHHPAQGTIHPLRYFAPVLSLALSCLMRHVRAWPSMNSPSAMAAAAGATCSVPSSVTFW